MRHVRRHKVNDVSKSKIVKSTAWKIIAEALEALDQAELDEIIEDVAIAYNLGVDDEQVLHDEVEAHIKELIEFHSK